MPGPSRPDRPGQGVRLTWRSGGWVLVLAGLFVAAVILWRVLDMLAGHGGRPVGDGKDPSTYGFDLGTLLVPRGR